MGHASGFVLFNKQQKLSFKPLVVLVHAPENRIISASENNAARRVDAFTFVRSRVEESRVNCVRNAQMWPVEHVQRMLEETSRLFSGLHIFATRCKLIIHRYHRSECTCVPTLRLVLMPARPIC